MWVDLPTIKSLIEDLTGIDVIFDPVQPRPFVSPTKKGLISVYIKAGQALGWDNFQRAYDEDADAVITNQVQNRLFVMSVKMESFNQTINAYETLEILRTKLFRPSSLARLRAQQMTATTAETIVDLPTEYDDHVFSVASLDVHMAVMLAEIDDTEPTDYIESYDIEGPVEP